MLDRFQRHVAERALFRPGELTLVGYSGGPDSTCLVHLMAQSGFEFVAAHLHHGQRAEADSESKLCEAFCGELGVPFVSGKADVPLIAEQQKIGVEEAGRRARYEFFRQVAARLGASRIATAHTRDDHVETVLLNLARGCGISGLAGIPEVRGEIIRPLLPFSRAETRAYCEANGLWTHDDPANTDIDFARARIRHRVLPELAAINPAIVDTVARLAGLADEEDRFLDAQAVHGMEHAEEPLNGRLRFLTLDLEAGFDRAKLVTLPMPLLRRGIRLVVSALGGTLDFRQSTLAAEGVAHSATGSITSEGGSVVIEWDPQRVHVGPTDVAAPFRYPLTVPGATDSPEFGWTLEAEACPNLGARFERDALEVVVDPGQLKGPLHFRSMQDGDAFVPMGFSGTRKLAEMMRGAGLTLAARRRLPIICDILGVVWAPGVSLADRVKAEAGAADGLRLRFGPLETGSWPPA